MARFCVVSLLCPASELIIASPILSFYRVCLLVDAALHQCYVVCVHPAVTPCLRIEVAHLADQSCCSAQPRCRRGAETRRKEREEEKEQQQQQQQEDDDDDDDDEKEEEEEEKERKKERRRRRGRKRKKEDDDEEEPFVCLAATCIPSRSLPTLASSLH